MFLKKLLRLCRGSAGWKTRAAQISVFFFVILIFIFSDRLPNTKKAGYTVGKPRYGSPFITTWARSHEDPSKKQWTPTKNKTILMWTDFFGSPSWGAAGSSAFQKCPVKSCVGIVDESQLATADAVLFNLRGFSSLSELPSVHPPSQVWIVHSSEPPYYIYVDLSSLSNMFNWTSSYRSDADIYSPFDAYVPVNAPDNKRVYLPHFPVLYNDSRSKRSSVDDSLLVLALDEPVRFHPSNGTPPSPVYLKSQILFDAYSEKSLLVFWAASSCVNYSQRYRLVEALQKYIPVDTYGHCGDMECWPKDAWCKKTLKEYKFVLAFENGYCRDYITEKYWNALHRNQIPIVSGGADYSRLGIPGSYIDVNDFNSVAELAAYIQKVGSDRQLYNSYFAWRSRYRLQGPGNVNWCKLCELLHDEDRPPQAYTDLKGWIADDSCPLYTPLLQTIWWGKQYLFFKLFGV